AIAQGTWRTFLWGEHYFASPLWTMRWELYGSAIVFVVAGVLIMNRNKGIQAIILVSAAVLLAYRSSYYFAFLLGVALAWLRCKIALEIPRAGAASLFLIAIYLLGFGSSRVGLYRWIPFGDATYLYGLGASLLLVSVVFCSPLHQKLEGVVGESLGRYSFPIYLVHVLVILSAGMSVFCLLYPLIGFAAAQIAAITTSLVGTLVVAHLFSLFESRWIVVVNKVADYVLHAAN